MFNLNSYVFVLDKWLLFSCLVTLFVSWFIYNYIKKWFCKLPPGPIGIPFFGCIPYLDKSPEKTFHKWSAKYGPVISLDIGNNKTVVLNTYEAIKEVICID